MPQTINLLVDRRHGGISVSGGFTHNQYRPCLSIYIIYYTIPCAFRTAVEIIDTWEDLGFGHRFMVDVLHSIASNPISAWGLCHWINQYRIKSDLSRKTIEANTMCVKCCAIIQWYLWMKHYIWDGYSKKGNKHLQYLYL